MNEHTEMLHEYLMTSKAPVEFFKALGVITRRLETYAIDIADAEQALRWKGVDLDTRDSVAIGIEKLNQKLLDKSAHERERIAELETAVNKVLDDEETGTVWGPDVTMVAVLRKAVGREA